MELCYEYFTTAKVCQNDMLRSYLLIAQIFWGVFSLIFQEVGHSSAL